MVAQGISDELPNKPFRIIVANLSKKPIHLTKRMLAGVGVDVPSRIVSFSVEVEDSVKAITNYKKKEKEETKLDRHRDVTHQDEN